MIPWVREKFAERRGKWIASRKRNDVGASCSAENCNSQQAHTSQRIDEKQNSTSNLKEDSKDFNIKGKLNVRVLSPTGRATFIEIDRQMKMFELKHQALQKFSGDSGALPLFAQDIRQLYPKYRLIRPDATTTVNEAHSLLEAGVNDNETFILVVRRVTTSNNRIFEGPTIEDINRATRNIYSSSDRNNRADINELVLQSDLQFDVRKVIISLAQESAYIIGAGPYATRLIVMLKQKLVNKIKHQSDTLQCLVDMGFTEERAKYALKLHNGIYSSALEWLIEHQEGPIEDNSPQPSVHPTSSLKQLHSNNIVENIETLLEIVRIYSHRDVPPTPEMVQSLVNMGFNEKEILTALRKTRNNQAAACEWLCGNRNNSLMELRDGLSKDSPILKTMMESPQVQMSLSNPKIFIAYLSMLDNQNALSMWLGDNDTSSIISHILRKYHEEKHVLGINQFNCVR